MRSDIAELTTEVDDGVVLRARRQTPAPPVAGTFVLVHGLASNARLWDAVAGHLRDAGYDTVAVDLRSHGASDQSVSGHDTTTAADDVAAVISHLAAGPVIAVGQSWGGNVVARLTARHPALISRVALIDGGWSDLSSHFRTLAEAETLLRPADIDGRPASELRGFIRAGHPAWSEEAVDATLANLRVDDEGRVHRRLPIPDHMAIVRSMWEQPPRADLGQIAVPVLLLNPLPTDPVAAADKRAAAEAAVSLLARAEIREYVGGDHDLHAQHPDSIAADLLTFAQGA